MKKEKQHMFLIQCAFMYFWLYFLSDTDSLFNIYYLCVLISVICFWSNRKSEKLPDKKQNIYLNVWSIILSVMVTCANYDTIKSYDYMPGIIKHIGIIFVIIGGYIIARNVICFLYNSLPCSYKLTKRNIEKKEAFLVWLCFFMLFFIIDFLYLYHVAYPGYLSSDSIGQVNEALYGFTSNHHPFWHTVIISACLKIGLFLFHNMNAAVACYSVISIVFIASCFTYALFTVYQTGIPKKAIIGCLLIYALMPYNIVYSVTMWKDVFFGGAALLLVVSLYRVLFKVGRHLFINDIFLFLSSIAFCVWRSNGIPAYFLTVIVFLILLARNNSKIKILSIMVLALVTSWIMCNPVIAHLGIQQPDLVESLSIPVQQVARVVKDGCDLTQEQEKLLKQIVPNLKEIADNYDKGLSDPIKDLIRKNPQYLNNHKKEYFNLWIQLGVKYPKEYVSAWIDQTKGYWNGGYDYWVICQGIRDNSVNIFSRPHEGCVRNCLYLYIRFMLEFSPVCSIGLHVWTLLAVFVASWFRKRKESFVCVPIIAILCTLLIATPVYCEFRYIYALFTSLPFIIMVNVYCKEDTI